MVNYFNDRSWKSDKEALLKRLEFFFGDISFDKQPSHPYHVVYTVINHAAAFLAMERLYGTFCHLNAESSLTKTFMTCFYLGDYNHRYKFMEISAKGVSEYFIIDEVRESNSLFGYRTKTAQCSNRVFLTVLLMLENEGRTAFNIEQTMLNLPNEIVRYRLHRMYTEDVTLSHVTPDDKDDHNEMILLYADGPTANGLVDKHCGAIKTFMTSSHFCERDATANHIPYSEWGFWNQINGLTDEYDEETLSTIKKVNDLLRSKHSAILGGRRPSIVRMDI